MQGAAGRRRKMQPGKYSLRNELPRLIALLRTSYFFYATCHACVSRVLLYLVVSSLLFFVYCEAHWTRSAPGCMSSSSSSMAMPRARAFSRVGSTVSRVKSSIMASGGGTWSTFRGGSICSRAFRASSVMGPSSGPVIRSGNLTLNWM